ncbi:melatonin receptor type 1B-B-like [Dendronephthya gigantea]|uniref:melatonin receptor type 1B-B-like n=1 Tax=Dendronephthya gigantea TaxID=151771 RepID=UPI00106957F2|nr:melatonin receptor type 1B-B-like [Dendronephthya gigantea]
MSWAAMNYTNSHTEFTLTDLEIGVLAAVNIIFSVVGSMGNILVCFAFLRSPRLRNTMNIFILSLSCSALLVCLIAQPMFAVSLIKHYQQEHITNAFEKVRKFFAYTSLLASAGNLLGVTLDRFLAIAKPFWYGDHDGIRPEALVFAAAVWCFAIGLGTGAILKEIIRLAVLSYVFIIVILVIIPLYIRILQIAAKHRKKILATRSRTSSLAVRDHQPPKAASSKYRFSRLHHKIDRSALVTVGVFCLVFVIGWFPLLVLPLIYRIIKEDRRLIQDVFQWVNTIALCSSACNPIVYASTDQRFRESLKLMYRRWVTRRQDLATIQGKSSRSSKHSNEISS